MKKTILLLMLMAITTISFGQVKRSSTRSGKRTAVSQASKKIDKNALIRDSLIQENSELFSYINNKPIKQDTLKQQGLIFKIMSVRGTDDGIIVRLFVENSEKDDTLTFDKSCCFIEFEGERYESFLPVKNNDISYFSHNQKNTPLSKGINYCFDFFFYTLKMPEKIDKISFRTMKYTLLNIYSYDFIFNDIKVDWDGGEKINNYQHSKSIDELKQDNIDYRNIIGINNTISSVLWDDIEYKVEKVIGKKNGNIIAKFLIHNKGKAKKIVFPSIYDYGKSPFIVFMNGNVSPLNKSISTIDTSNFDLVYQLNNGNHRTIDLGFDKKYIKGKPRIIPLLRLYEENSGKVLEFRNLSVSWE